MSVRIEEVGGEKYFIGHVDAGTVEIFTGEYWNGTSGKIFFPGGKKGSDVYAKVADVNHGLHNISNTSSSASYSTVTGSVASDPSGILTLISSEDGLVFVDTSDPYYPYHSYYSPILKYSYNPSIYYSPNSSDSDFLFSSDGQIGTVTCRWSSGNYGTTKSATLTFTKAYEVVDLAANDSHWGSVYLDYGSSSSGSSGDVPAGDTFTIIAVPNEHFEFSHWRTTSGYTDRHDISGKTSSTLTRTALPREKVNNVWCVISSSYVAVFKRRKYSVSITSTLPDGVSISARYAEPEGSYVDTVFPVSLSVDYKTIVALNIKGDVCCYWAYSVSRSDGVEISWGGWWSTEIYGDTSFEIIFTKKYNPIRIYLTGFYPANGKFWIDGQGPYTSEQTILRRLGDTVTIKAEPDYGYYINDSNFNPSGGEYIYEVPCSPHYYGIRIDKAAIITVEVSPSNTNCGCVYGIDTSIAGCVTSQTAVIIPNTTIVLRAKPSSCYKFDKWTSSTYSIPATNPAEFLVSFSSSGYTITAHFVCDTEKNDKLIHCNGDILYDGETGLPIFQECDCSN